MFVKKYIASINNLGTNDLSKGINLPQDLQKIALNQLRGTFCITKQLTLINGFV